MLTDAPPAAERGQPTRVSRRYGRFLLVLTLAVLAISAWKFKVTGQPPFLHRENVWSVALYTGESPFDLKPSSINNEPILTADDVTDVDALFVADPFMVFDNGQQYLFVEILNRATGQGDIGVATSDDGGKHWRYQSVVLDEPWHLSYPSVFRWQDRWWMVPQGDTGVHLYSADAFPSKWSRQATLLKGDHWADPTLFRHQDTWWMFVGRSGTHDDLQLFFADKLSGPWQEHPQSPIIQGDAEVARPGGKIISYEGSLYRFAQDCAPKYGNQLRGFRITTLDRQAYAERPIEQEFVLRAGSHDWNANGMHHLDAHQNPDGGWSALVDGHQKTWLLGWTP